MTAAKPLPITAESDLPEGWVEANFLDVIDYEGGAQPPKKQFVYEQRKRCVRLLQIRDFGPKPFPTFVPDSPRLKKAAENDLLLARYGGDSADDSLGRICTGLAGAYNVALVKLKFDSESLNRDFVRLFFKGPWFKSAISVNSRSCQRGFNRDDLRWLKFPLAPRPEQERIAKKTEQLLARVNAARERLARVPSILKRFRQAVLAAACYGRLTAAWREERSDLESATELLARITPPPQRAHGRFSPELPRSPEADDLPEIPDKWCYATLDQVVSEPLANGRSVPDAKEGFPVLRLTALRNRRIKLDERKIGAWTASEAARFLVRRNDFLVARGNGSLSLVGRGGLVDCDPDPVAYPDTLIRVRVSEGISPEYLALFWDSDLMRTQVESKAHTTAGIHKISQKDMLELVLAIPPTTEQQEISRRVEAVFKIADTIEKRVAAATARAEKLTQAILARAFRGELVPTEAELARREGRSYEPASALLARIQTAAEALSQKPNQRSPKRRPPATRRP